jgi:hypothetical protein
MCTEGQVERTADNVPRIAPMPPRSRRRLTLPLSRRTAGTGFGRAASDDAAEGVRSFTERRKGRFTGR